MSTDPVGALDNATIIVGSVLYACTAVLVAYAWYHYKYLPLRAKNLNIATLMLVCGIIWFISDIPTNGHIAIVGVWSKCKAWHLWMRLIFGYSFSMCVLARLYALHCVFMLHRPFRGFAATVPILFGGMALVAYCLVGQLISDRLTIEYISESKICRFATPFLATNITLLWIIWALILFYMVKIRDIHASFNEWHESVIIFIITLVSLLQTTIIPAVHTDYTRILAMRVASTWVDFINGNLTIWIILAPTLYRCLLHHDEYLQMWRRKLERDGLKHEYNISDPQRAKDKFYPRPPESDLMSYQFPLREERMMAMQVRGVSQYNDMYGFRAEHTSLTLNQTILNNSLDSLTDGGIDSSRRLV